MNMKPLAALLALVVLAACQPSPRKQAEMAEAARPFLTAPLIRAEIPARKATAVLRPVGQNGDVTTWQTVDDITLSFADGILVSSRGLGFDLMGADASLTRAGLAGQAPDIYRRKMRYLTGDNHSTWLTAGCSMARAGVEAGLRRFEESCRARDETFTNVYLLDRAGRVASSRQWLSPQIGYIDIGPFSLPADAALPRQ
jgi:hypothetical protein